MLECIAFKVQSNEREKLDTLAKTVGVKRSEANSQLINAAEVRPAKINFRQNTENRNAQNLVGTGEAVL